MRVKSASAPYEAPYPTWIVAGMDVLAAGILIASFRDAWSVVRSLGEDSGTWANSLVAAAVVLAIDASILLLEQARSQVKLRGGNTRYSDLWVMVLILLSASLNVRYLAATGPMLDRIIGGVLGVAIPSTIAVLGYLKGDMLAYNAELRQRTTEPLAVNEPIRDPQARRPHDEDDLESDAPVHAGAESTMPFFRLDR